MKKFEKTPRCDIEYFIRKHIENVCLTYEDAVYVYDPVMIKMTHDTVYGNEESFSTKKFYDLSLKRVISWLTTKCWSYVHQVFLEKYGEIPECIENRTYLKEDKVKVTKAKKEVKKDKVVEEYVPTQEDIDHTEKMTTILELLTSMEKNLSVVMCDVLLRAMKAR